MCYYKCNNCNYNVETVCGYSVGRIAVLETYVCKDCNIVTDSIFRHQTCWATQHNTS